MTLFQNLGDGKFTPTEIPLSGNKGSGGSAWLDVDNDGDLDLLIATWANSRADGYVLLNNVGNESFEESTVTTFSFEFSRSPAVADYDNDGAMDFYLMNPDGPDSLWRNQGGEQHWLKLGLEGSDSNRSGIGAIVRVKAVIGGVETWQMRHIAASGETLYAQHDRRPNFGLGDATVVDEVRIEWPSGTVQVLTDVAVDQILNVVEPPTLSVETALILSWPVAAESWLLFGANNVDGPYERVALEVVGDGDRSTVTVPTGERMQFYQLRQP